MQQKMEEEKYQQINEEDEEQEAEDPSKMVSD